MMPVTLAVFLLGLVLIVVVSVFVAAPLFASAGAPAPPPADADGGTRARWERQKRQALAAIGEAEMDHRMGKLSEEDLRALRARLEAEALEAMAALERETKP